MYNKDPFDDIFGPSELWNKIGVALLIFIAISSIVGGIVYALIGEWSKAIDALEPVIALMAIGIAPIAIVLTIILLGIIYLSPIGIALCMIVLYVKWKDHGQIKLRESFGTLTVFLLFLAGGVYLMLELTVFKWQMWRNIENTFMTLGMLVFIIFFILIGLLLLSKMSIIYIRLRDLYPDLLIKSRNFLKFLLWRD